MKNQCQTKAEVQVHRNESEEHPELPLAAAEFERYTTEKEIIEKQDKRLQEAMQALQKAQTRRYTCENIYRKQRTRFRMSDKKMNNSEARW